VRLVELVPIRLLARRGRLVRVAELDEREPLRVARLRVRGHDEAVLADNADLAEDLAEDGGELAHLGLGDLREVVHDDHRAKPGLGRHLLDVHVLVVAVRVAEAAAGWGVPEA
jgi:hypothetical protein